MEPNAPTPDPAPPHESAPEAAPSPRRRLWNWRTVKSALVRIYALALLIIVGWAGLLAFVYLYQFVFVPQPVPERFVKWEANIDPASLRNGKHDDEKPLRAPLSHYHQSERLTQKDPKNGCTIAGCHEPLPHTNAKQVPAFANFHTTFLSCEMCHDSTAASSGSAAWFDLAAHARTDGPALLKLIRYLDESAGEVQSNPRAAHARITPLLARVVQVADREPLLEHLRLQIDTSEPGSPVWRRSVEHLKGELPAHVRGEYGAKLTRDASRYAGEFDRLSELAPGYNKSLRGTAERQALHQQAHRGIVKEAVACTTCHGGERSSLDYAGLGYGPARSRHLSQLQLANLMQQIRSGERFYIPRLLGTGDGR
jgi:hypothetical protein